MHPRLLLLSAILVLGTCASACGGDAAATDDGARVEFAQVEVQPSANVFRHGYRATLELTDASGVQPIRRYRPGTSIPAVAGPMRFRFGILACTEEGCPELDGVEDLLQGVEPQDGATCRRDVAGLDGGTLEPVVTVRRGMIDCTLEPG